MREIMFRGMDIKGNWHYGLVSVLSEKYKSMPDPGVYISNSAGAPFAYDIRPETLGQFTGLLDKNDKEIYEGDILGMESFTPWVVTFEKGSFCIANITFQVRLFSFFDIDITNREVIGNIHENPELLEVSK